jgi:predicted nuclease with TOPRIM domain
LDIQTILEYGVTALGGGAVFKVLDYYINVKKEKRTDFDTINQRLNEEIQRLYKRIDDLEKENKELENRVKILEGSTEDLPFAMWHKDLNGNYVWVNQKFINNFLIPLSKTPDQILSKDDSALWQGSTHSIFIDLDTRALASPTKEASQRGVSLDSRIPGTFIIYKYPLYVRRVLTGFAGIALPE